MTVANRMPEDRARPRTLRCSQAELEVINQRAKARGLTRSEFMVKCALHVSEEPGQELVLSADEQRVLCRQVKELALATQTLSARHPATGMSLLEAVMFLARAAGDDAGTESTA